MKNQIKPLIILLIFGFICHNFGPISRDLSGLIIFTSLIVYLFINASLIKKENISYIILFVLASLFISRLDNVLLQLFSLSAFLFGLLVFCRWRGYSTNEHVISLLTTIFFAFVIFFYQYFTECWYIVRLYSTLFSYICGCLYACTLNLGHTSFGFFVIISFAIYHAIIFLLNEKGDVVRLIFAICYIFCASIIFVGINLLIVFISNKYFITLYRNDLHSQFLLFLILCPSILFLKDIRIRQVSLLWNKKLYRFTALLLVVFAISIVFFTSPFLFKSHTEINDKNIVFYKKGSLDWDIPRLGSYGQRSGGMFGIMPRYLRGMGFNTAMIDKITIDDLLKADVLVMINLDEGLKRDELLAVWDFVRNGGGLLLLGDHTNLSGLMVNFNELLEIVNIRFKFDSAMPSRYTWDYLMEIRPHPVSKGFDRAISRSWWVGASLECQFPAEPVVIGKYCYSDWGYKHNVQNAYLGNRRFDYYEPLNDQVLAAYARYGKGMVLVFGDTSSFHNTTFMATYDFIFHVFNLLSRREIWLSPICYYILKVFLIISVAFCALLAFRHQPNLVLPLAFIFILFPAILLSNYNPRYPQMEDDLFDRFNVAYIDYSHKGRFDLMSWEDDSIGGLRNNLSRNGFFPLLLNEFDASNLLKAKLLVIIAPTQSFGGKEIRLLKEFVEKGGKLLISVGWEEQKASLSLLASFGLKIDNIPLGWCSANYKNTSVQFHEVWPIIFGDKKDVEVICKPLGFPAIVSRKIGKGYVVLIADSYFLLNENLEGSERYSVPNMFLLRDLLFP